MLFILFSKLFYCLFKTRISVRSVGSALDKSLQKMSSRSARATIPKRGCLHKNTSLYGTETVVNACQSSFI